MFPALFLMRGSRVDVRRGSTHVAGWSRRRGGGAPSVDQAGRRELAERS